MMKRTAVIAALLTSGMLAACQNPANRITYDGEYFRAKAAKVDKQRDVFSVTVSGVAKSPKGARLAAYHTGVSYCLPLFGSSEIDWVVDPLDEETALRVSDDTVTFQGRCPQAQNI